MISQKFQSRINALLVIGKIIDKANRDRQLYLLNGNSSPITTQTDPTFDHVYEPELQETPVTPLNSKFSTPVLDRQIETLTIGQQQTYLSILENELFVRHYAEKSSLHNF